MKTETKKYVAYLLEHDFDYWMDDVRHARSTVDTLCELDPNQRDDTMAELYRTLESNVQWDLDNKVKDGVFTQEFADAVEIPVVSDVMLDDANHHPFRYAKELNEIRQGMRARQFKAVA